MTNIYFDVESIVFDDASIIFDDGSIFFDDGLNDSQNKIWILVTVTT